MMLYFIKNHRSSYIHRSVTSCASTGALSILRELFTNYSVTKLHDHRAWILIYYSDLIMLDTASMNIHYLQITQVVA